MRAVAVEQRALGAGPRVLQGRLGAGVLALELADLEARLQQRLGELVVLRAVVGGRGLGLDARLRRLAAQALEVVEAAPQGVALGDEREQLAAELHVLGLF